MGGQFLALGCRDTINNIHQLYQDFLLGIGLMPWPFLKEKPEGKIKEESLMK
jgi:hypothetical protein